MFFKHQIRCYSFLVWHFTSQIPNWILHILRSIFKFLNCKSEKNVDARFVMKAFFLQIKVALEFPNVNQVCQMLVVILTLGSGKFRKNRLQSKNLSILNCNDFLLYQSFLTAFIPTFHCNVLRCCGNVILVFSSDTTVCPWLRSWE